MWIASIAHNETVGIGRIQDWATHEIGNELSALYDTPHGVTLSAVMGSWMRYVYKNHMNRFARYAYEVFGVSREMEPEQAALTGIAATDCDFETMLDHINFRNGNQTIGGITLLNREDVRNILIMSAG